MITKFLFSYYTGRQEEHVQLKKAMFDILLCRAFAKNYEGKGDTGWHPSFVQVPTRKAVMDCRRYGGGLSESSAQHL